MSDDSQTELEARAVKDAFNAGVEACAKFLEQVALTDHRVTISLTLDGAANDLRKYVVKR
jgi:hypothetical protein